MFVNTTTWVNSPFPFYEDEDIFAIGDVHGHYDELNALHSAIHFCKNDRAQSLIVHLGDYIDRGPNSKKVLNFLSNYNDSNVKSICLPGNHDQFLIELIKPELDPDLDRYFIDNWYENGGIETMKDLGVEGYGRLMHKNNIKELRKRTMDALGGKIINFLLSLELTYKQGNYFFVHAGINPGKSVHAQSIRDLLMIREPFLSSSTQWGYSFCVVHGHSISSPNVYAHRVSTDAGVYINGTLCAAQISQQGIRFVGVTKEREFPWGNRFNNESIGLIWGTPKQI